MVHGTDSVASAAPGWYPDPWDPGPGRFRYFNGTRWTGAVRTLEVGPAGPPQPAPSARTARSARPRRRLRWVLAAEVALLLVVALVVGSGALVGDGVRDGLRALLAPPPTTQVAPGPDPAITPAAEAPVPLGTPEAVPDGPGDHAFLATQELDPTRPVAFDPCRPIRYVVNPAGAPADGTELVRTAVATISAATGLQFVFDGFTDEVPPSRGRAIVQPERYGADRFAPVIVAWADEDSEPELGGRVVGYGGPRGVVIGDEAVYVSGLVLLDRDDLSLAESPDRAVARATVLHELAHVVGLDHTPDATQIMHDVNDGSVTELGAGDRRGLAALGAQACFPDLDASRVRVE